MSFKAAASIGLKEALRKAKPILLEPVMEIEVVTPAEALGTVLGDLNSRRSSIQNIEGGDDIQRVRALIPLVNSFGYATNLRSMTQGRATHTMEFKQYESVPQGLLTEIVKQG